ncbi:endonuclease [Nanoarchaeota archaeon]|nr:MAG: endonuclease [Nanoarchaeota archaeon]
MEWVAILIFVLVLLLFIQYFLIRSLKRIIRDLQSSKHSMASRYGKMSEQFMPFLDNYPFNPNDFRFIGSPIDGVQFTDDMVYFIEFKVGSSSLTQKQKRIKKLIEEGKVQFKEIRIK